MKDGLCLLINADQQLISNVCKCLKLSRTFPPRGLKILKFWLVSLLLIVSQRKTYQPEFKIFNFHGRKISRKTTYSTMEGIILHLWICTHFNYIGLSRRWRQITCDVLMTPIRVGRSQQYWSLGCNVYGDRTHNHAVTNWMRYHCTSSAQELMKQHST